MRALLVQARSPRTYWSFEQSLPFIGKAATMPPLGLATLAAHLPERWELRPRDLNVAPLEDADLRWADAVLVSGMLVQAPSTREVLLRARALGRRTVVGGAGPSTAPELFPEADHVFRGEAEGRCSPASSWGSTARDRTSSTGSSSSSRACRSPGRWWGC